MVDMSHPDANTLLEDMGNQHIAAMKGKAQFSFNVSDDKTITETKVLTNESFRKNIEGHPAIKELYIKESRYILKNKLDTDYNWENVRFLPEDKPSGGWTKGKDILSAALRFLGIRR